MCRYNKNIIHRRVQGVCLCMWAGDGLCLEFMFVCVFFFLPANAKKGKKKKLRNTCVCVGKRSIMRPRFFPVSTLRKPLQRRRRQRRHSGAMFKCACKGCQGGINLISRWGAGKKQPLPPRIKHNLPIKTSLSGRETSINNISAVQIR